MYHLKTEERQLRAAGMTKEASALRKKWRLLTKEYEIYSIQHDRSFYRYRILIDAAEVPSVAEEGLTDTSESDTIKADEWANGLPPRGQIDLPEGMSKAEFIQQELKVDAKKAADFEKALTAYSDDDYTDIRAYQCGEKVDDPDRLKKIADDLEEYIKRAPRWDGGETYRGVGLTDEQLETFTVGSEHDMLGVSSWSSELSVAQGFAERARKWSTTQERAIVFHCATQTKGTAIRHLSELKREDEVLVSKDSRYIVVRREVDGQGMTHIYLEEKL